MTSKTVLIYWPKTTRTWSIKLDSLTGLNARLLVWVLKIPRKRYLKSRNYLISMTKTNLTTWTKKNSVYFSGGYKLNLMQFNNSCGSIKTRATQSMLRSSKTKPNGSTYPHLFKGRLKANSRNSTRIPRVKFPLISTPKSKHMNGPSIRCQTYPTYNMMHSRMKLSRMISMMMFIQQSKTNLKIQLIE